MLTSTKAFSGFSVDNLDKAKEFYGQTLGLKVTEAMEGAVNIHLPGGAEVFIYEKGNHVPATFTILNFMVSNIDEAVDGLTKSGVKFESYSDGPIKTDDVGIARGGEGKSPTIAWFKDPAGNFLSVIEEK